jgi:hypothetical protein
VRGVLYAVNLTSKDAFRGSLTLIRRQARLAASHAAQYLRDGGARPARLSREEAARFIALQQAHINGTLNQLSRQKPSSPPPTTMKIVSPPRQRQEPARQVPTPPSARSAVIPSADGEDPASPRRVNPRPADAPATLQPADAPAQPFPSSRLLDPRDLDELAVVAADPPARRDPPIPPPLRPSRPAPTPQRVRAVPGSPPAEPVRQHVRAAVPARPALKKNQLSSPPRRDSAKEPPRQKHADPGRLEPQFPLELGMALGLIIRGLHGYVDAVERRRANQPYGPF